MRTISYIQSPMQRTNKFLKSDTVKTPNFSEIDQFF